MASRGCRGISPHVNNTRITHEQHLLGAARRLFHARWEMKLRKDLLQGIERFLKDHEVDEVIVATLPKRVSRWLGSDIPHQIERRFGLPVTTIISRH